MQFFQINPEPIVVAGRRENVLRIVGNEIRGLNRKWPRECVQSGDFLSLEIQLKNLLFFCENERCYNVVFFEQKLHTDSFEVRHVLENYQFIKLEQCAHAFFAWSHIFLENEQTILTLLREYQVFATDHTDVVFALRFLEADDFVIFSRLGTRDWYMDVANRLVSFVFDPDELIFVGHQYEIQALDLYRHTPLKIFV